MKRVLIAAILLATAHAAGATEFCVTNSAQLNAALILARFNGEDDVIRIAAGQYPAPVGGFIYNATVDGGDDRHLTLIGGWTEFFGNPCGQLLSESPFHTVINGGGTERPLQIRVRPNSNVTVRQLTFLNGVGGSGAGVYVHPASPSYAAVMVFERNAFINNQSNGSGGGLFTGSTMSGLGRTLLINNLFVANHAASDYGAALVYQNGGLGVWVTNNTIVSNTVGTANRRGGLEVGGQTHRYVYNNNIWGNQYTDLRLSGPNGAPTTQLSLRNNNIGVRDGSSPNDFGGNINADPQFGPGLLNFTPLRGSPLVDSGRHPGGGIQVWYLTQRDLNDGQRVVGATVDIGAYENERLFSSGFQATVPLHEPPLPAALCAALGCGSPEQ